MSQTEEVKEKPYIGDWVASKWNSMKAFVKACGTVIKDKPEIAIPLVTGVVALYETGSDVRIHRDELKWRREDKRSWTDPKTGITAHFKRSLTNDEARLLYEAEVNNENVWEVLDSLDVLK